MSDQEHYVELRPEDPDWIRRRLESTPGNTRVVLKPIEDDLDSEGHAMGTTLRLQAFGDEDDTEGHAVSVHFPTREDAAAFRRRLMVTGALTGTLVLGAAGGFGLANIVGEGTGSGAVTTTQSAPGMDWTQAERPGQAAGAAGAVSAPGMDWTQAERPGQAAAGAVSAPGMDWTQAERPGQAGADSKGGSGADAPARGTNAVPE